MTTPHTPVAIHVVLSDTRKLIERDWLRSYHSLSQNSTSPGHSSFGSLYALGEDYVQPRTGFPTHHHRDFEIFTYVLSGELTHRDSMSHVKAEESGDEHCVIRRNDVQFTTGGTGISHSETNEHVAEHTHFLQIWVTPWKKGLTPRYHTRSFTEDEKKKGFVKVISPLKAGKDASLEQETDAVPVVPGTIPIHSDFVMAAGIIAPGTAFEWSLGGDGSTTAQARKVYVHLPATVNGGASIKITIRGQEVALSEGDGVFITEAHASDCLIAESIGSADAEVIVLDGE